MKCFTATRSLDVLVLNQKQSQVLSTIYNFKIY